MTIAYHVSQDGLRIETFPRGVLDIRKTIDYFKKLRSDTKIRPGAIEIVYFKHVTDFNISYSDSEKIVRSYEDPQRERRIDGTIFVCENDLSYGIGRMLQTLHEMANPGRRVAVIRSEDGIGAAINLISPTQ